LGKWKKGRIAELWERSKAGEPMYGGLQKLTEVMRVGWRETETGQSARERLAVRARARGSSSLLAEVEAQCVLTVCCSASLNPTRDVG
jgi:hypothetical protein